MYNVKYNKLITRKEVWQQMQNPSFCEMNYGISIKYYFDFSRHRLKSY